MLYRLKTIIKKKLEVLYKHFFLTYENFPAVNSNCIKKAKHINDSESVPYLDLSSPVTCSNHSRYYRMDRDTHTGLLMSMECEKVPCALKLVEMHTACRATRHQHGSIWAPLALHSITFNLKHQKLNFKTITDKMSLTTLLFILLFEVFIYIY